MGLATMSTTPSRPGLDWDSKSLPWTDGKGNQKMFNVAVEDWVEYHYSLPDTHTTKISKKMKGLILKSQLYGKAADMCSALTKEELKSDNGVNLIVNATYRRDALNVI